MATVKEAVLKLSVDTSDAMVKMRAFNSELAATNVGVALDPKIVREWVDSPDGERTVVKIMARNKQILKS